MKTLKLFKTWTVTCVALFQFAVAAASQIELQQPTDGALILVQASGEKSVPLEWETKLPGPFLVEVTRLGAQKWITNLSAEQNKKFITLPIGRYSWRIAAKIQGVVTWTAESKFEIAARRETDVVPIVKIVIPAENQVVTVPDSTFPVAIQYVLFPSREVSHYQVQISRDAEFRENIAFDKKVGSEKTEAKLGSGTHFVRVRAKVGKIFTKWSQVQFEVETSNVWSGFSHASLSGGGYSTQQKLKTNGYLGPLATTTFAAAKFDSHFVIWKWNAVFLDAAARQTKVDGAPLSTNLDQKDLVIDEIESHFGLRTNVYNGASFSRQQIFFDVFAGKQTLTSLYADFSSPTSIVEGPIIKSQSSLTTVFGGGVGTSLSLRSSDRVTLNANYEVNQKMREFKSSSQLKLRLNYQSRLGSRFFYTLAPHVGFRNTAYSGSVTGSSTETNYGLWVGVGISY